MSKHCDRQRGHFPVSTYPLDCPVVHGMRFWRVSSTANDLILLRAGVYFDAISADDADAVDLRISHGGYDRGNICSGDHAKLAFHSEVPTLRCAPRDAASRSCERDTQHEKAHHGPNEK